MGVYMIADVDVTDEKKYAEYIREAESIVLRHGGRYRVRGGAPRGLSGDWQPKRVVVIEFDSEDSLRGCFESEEYREIVHLRLQSATSRGIIVDSYEMEE